MATWRCPNCRTVQSETSRCFLCSRSATSCGTCANFRGSVVGGLGYCALDRRREPLSGAEQRPCWSSAVSAVDDGLFATPHVSDPGDAPRAARLVDAPVTRG